MRCFIKILMTLSVFWVLGFASQGTPPDSIEPLYANAAGLDLMSDAPWVIEGNDTIPFSFIIKDCEQYQWPGEKIEFYCIAIYDISDGVKYYGDEIVPALNNIDTIILYPPLIPNPLSWSLVPNQVFYEDYIDLGYSSPPNFNTYNWWKKEVTQFKHIGSKWNNYYLNGTPITPAALGYYPGDTITFRTIIVCRIVKWDNINYRWLFIPRCRERDMRIIVTGEQNPLPKISNWYLTDCHTHSWNTDNEIEYGGVTPFMAKIAKKIGLDCVIFTDHSNDLPKTQNWNDGWGSGTGWGHLGWECYNFQGLLIIRGEEISSHCLGGHSWVPSDERHFLGFDIESCIIGDYPLPGATNYDIHQILGGGPPPNYGSVPSNNLRAQGGFAYMAHPAEYYNRFADSASIDSALRHSVFRGLQVFNCRKTYESDDEWHPWGEFPYGGTWDTAYVNWFDEYEGVLKLYDKRLSQKLDPIRKIFLLGGSDAHGDFNYSIGKVWTGPWHAGATTLGCWRTAVYCPTGLTRDNILNGLKMGRSVVTDGPMMIFGLDMNNDGDIYDAGNLMKMKKYFSGLDGWFSFIIIVC